MRQQKRIWFFFYDPYETLFGLPGGAWIPKYDTKILNKTIWPIQYTFAKPIDNKIFFQIYDWALENIGPYHSDWFLYRRGDKAFHTIALKDEKYLSWLKVKFPIC